MPSPEAAPAPNGAPTQPTVPVEIANLPPDQIAAILRNIPDVFKNVRRPRMLTPSVFAYSHHPQLGDGDLKEVASTLSQLQNAGATPAQAAALYPPPVHVAHPASLEPGPSSHPRGPPNLGDTSLPLMTDDEEPDILGDASGMPEGLSPGGSGGRRGGRNATMSNDEWTRQRKDNHVCTSPVLFVCSS
jgi:hypothetical protein